VCVCPSSALSCILARRLFCLVFSPSLCRSLFVSAPPHPLLSLSLSSPSLCCLPNTKFENVCASKCSCIVIVSFQPRCRLQYGVSCPPCDCVCACFCAGVRLCVCGAARTSIRRARATTSFIARTLSHPAAHARRKSKDVVVCGHCTQAPGPVPLAALSRPSTWPGGQTDRFSAKNTWCTSSDCMLTPTTASVPSAYKKGCQWSSNHMSPLAPEVPAHQHA
jgi:hypothetical protein